MKLSIFACSALLANLASAEWFWQEVEGTYYDPAANEPEEPEYKPDPYEPRVNQREYIIATWIYNPNEPKYERW